MYQETNGLNVLVWIVLTIFVVPAGIVGGVVFAIVVYLVCMKELAKAVTSWLLSFGGPSDAFN